MMEIRKITVNTSRSYELYIGGGLLEHCADYIKQVTGAKRFASAKFAVITDDNVNGLYGETVENALKSAGAEVFTYAFPHGEASKQIDTLSGIYGFLSAHNITRSDCVVALGGGVAGDIAGFAAATYLRGLDYVQIPTTLLAQVDSSVGGKTAIDLPDGKNLVGAFWQPRLVLIDPNTLNTLPAEYFTDGMGEVVKYGMIRSKTLFELLEKRDLNSIRGDLSDVIEECVIIKSKIVEADEFDKGERMLLNFGHTLGHVLEKKLNFTGISHGKAVAAGMKMLTDAAEKAGLAQSGLTARLTACLERYDLNAEVEFSPYELALACGNDKKRLDGLINIIICEKAGESLIKSMSLEEFADLMR